MFLFRALVEQEEEVDDFFGTVTYAPKKKSKVKKDIYIVSKKESFTEAEKILKADLPAARILSLELLGQPVHDLKKKV